MGAALVAQQGFGDNTASTTTVWAPSAITLGSTLVLWYRSTGSGSSSFTACTDTGGNTWIRPDPPRGGVSGTSNTFLVAAYCHNAVQPGTITLTHSNSGSRLVKLIEASGLAPIAPDVATEDFTNVTPTTDVRSSAGTTNYAGDLLIGGANYSATGAYPTGMGGGFTLLTQPAATGGRLASAYKIGSAAGAEQAIFTGVTPAVPYGAGLLAFRAIPDPVVLGRASSVQTARPLTQSKAATLARASEADAARALSSSKAATLGRASETDAARALILAKTQTLGRISEVDGARALETIKALTVGRAGETDAARPLMTGKALEVARAGETDQARPLVLGKVITLGRAGETSTARPVTAGIVVPVVTPAERTTTPPYESRTTIVPPRARTTVPPDTRITTPA